MKKLNFFAAGLSLVFAVCSAFTSIKPPNTVKYEVTGTDGAYYILDENVTLKSPGTDYTCSASSQICTMEAKSTDVTQRHNQTEVPISAVTNTQPGIFSDL